MVAGRRRQALARAAGQARLSQSGAAGYGMSNLNPAHELAVLKKMAEELPDYLLSDVLFWQMQAPSSFPKLSLGMLLLTRRRLDAVDPLLDQSQRTERNQAARQIDTTLNKWRVAAERKAEQDLRARTNLWQRYW